LTQNKLLKNCKTVIFLFIVFTLASSVVSTAAFVLTSSGNMNNNIVFAKKSKGSGGSSKDNGGSSSDTSSPTESSSNDQGSNTPSTSESDNKQPSSTGSEPEKQQQPPAAGQTPCPDGSQPDENGDCPTPPATQSTGPPAGGAGQEQQQCPTGQHFDTNQNACVNDTTLASPSQGLARGDLPPSALETSNNPPLIPECSAGFKPDGKGGCMPDCGQGSHYESKIHRCQPDNVTCTGESHYDTFTNKCETNDKGMPPFGECVEGYHLDKLKEGNAEKCYNNASPISYNGNCAPGWHLLPGVSYKICVADSTPVTKGSVLNLPTRCTSINSHLDEKTGKCVNELESLCVTGNPRGYIDSRTGECVPEPHCPGQTHFDKNTEKCEPNFDPKQCGVLGAPAHYDPNVGECVFDNASNNPSQQQSPQAPQTGEGGGSGTGGTIPIGQGGGTGTQPQTVKCGKDTHPDPKTGTCTVNDVPLANGACAAGYHFGKDQSICIKDTTTISPKNCEAGSHYDTNYRDCVDDRYPILSKSGIGSSCVAGYHLEADKLCHKDTTTTTTMPNQKTTCSTDQHLESGKCVDNNVPLSNGKCVPGYHLDTKPAVTKQVGFCIKDQPSSKTPSTEPSTVPPINGACMEPAYHLGDDNLCHLDVIGNTPAETPAQPPSISLSQPECEPGFHWDNSQLQCVADSK
jgi:hypothetical protein